MTVGVLYLHGQNKYKTRIFVKNGFHKSKRTVHFGCKMLFWVGQNRLNSDNQLCMPEFTTNVDSSWDIGKDFFRTCHVLPFNCTHLALQRQGKRPKVHEKQKGFKNFFRYRYIT